MKASGRRLDLVAARERALALADAISARVAISREDILGRSRSALVAAARHHLIVNLWREGYGIAEIARILQRDHTTVAYGMRKVLGDTAYLTELAARYPDLEKGRAHRFAKCKATSAQAQRRTG